jgi:3-oxoadipate enol-lactonase
MNGFIRIDGVVLHYSHRPAAEGGETVVFINSLGTDFRIWQAVVDRLPDDWGYLLYDKRGHGLSGLGETPYSIEMLARDLAGLLDALSISRAHICGLSVGGLIAQALYFARPQTVKSLILCDTASKIGTHEMWTERISAVAANGIESIAGPVLERWFSAAYRNSGDPAFEGYANMLIRQPREGYIATCAALRDADYVEASRKIALPVMGIVGDEDGSTPPDLVRDMIQRIAGARFELIKSAGHLPCIEQPDAVAALIRSFVSQ